MTRVTLKVLDGADRGRIYKAMETPITIGREEGNSIQLNDDRVSRFHIKIQEDHEKVVLTDLESTNGTKVNGEETQLRILRYGDMIMVGRSVLLFGTRDEIAARLAALRGEEAPLQTFLEEEDVQALADAVSLDFELNWREDDDMQSTLHILEPPELPDRLDPVQAAQLSELIEYLHIRMRGLLRSVDMDEDEHLISLDQRQWQNLLDLQARLAEYLRAISDPDA
jgi:pSer/pThr/pTyr-binding forkhead associated (FHA) protein